MQTSIRRGKLSRAETGWARAFQSCVLFLATVCVGAAQRLPMFDHEGDLLLSAQLKLPAEVAVANHPTPLEVPLIWRGERLLNGRLHYNFYDIDPKDPLLKMVSPPLTLDTIPRRLQAMIPAIPNADEDANILSVDLEFVEDGNPEPFDLETHSMQLAADRYPVDVEVLALGRVRNIEKNPSRNYQSTAHTIAVIHSEFGSDHPIFQSQRTWWRNYSPDLRSAVSSDPEYDFPPITHPAEIPAKEFPRSELELAGYDACSLQEGISVLDEQQLEALAKWLRLGGRGIVGTTDAPHRSFLQESGCASIPDFPLREPTLLSCDLGRLLLLPANYKPHTETSTKRSSKDDNGEETIAVQLHGEEHVRLINRLWQSDIYITPSIEWDTAELLAPSGLDTLPVKSILICLGLFLLAAAPFDYFYLGTIRRRNLTWIIYPIAALTCSWLVVRATDARFSGDENGQWKIITLGTDGTPLRSVTFNLLLNNSHAEERFEGTDAFYSAFPIQRDWNDPLYDQHHLSRLHDWTATGSYPTNFTSSFRLAKLTPAIERIEQHYPSIQIPDLNWNEIDPWSMPELPTARSYSEMVSHFGESFRDGQMQIHSAAYFAEQQPRSDQPPTSSELTKLAQDSLPVGEAAICIPSTKLTDDLACAAFTVQDGNRFTTYVRLFSNPVEPSQ